MFHAGAYGGRASCLVELVGVGGDGNDRFCVWVNCSIGILVR